MNVYQRPLFRQAGGPVAPGMAAQEAMMPPQAPMMGGQDPAAQLAQAEAMASERTAPLGAQYAQEMLAGIDAAETPEQIINALRGNQVPMEQRYAELAQFVGEADAQRTPESVLALVQPTIMMTEQGAMDSGIGELMQGLIGDVEMETEGGAPTAMGQGVGSLMMAGTAQPGVVEVREEPVANFRQGGVVQRFQAGGEASRLQTLYSEMLPVYQGILGDGGEQQRMTQAQILFDIADRAGAFAAGIDPRTGQSIAGLSPAAQLAAAASGLGGQIGQRLGAQEEQDRALRLAALQAAQGEYSAERAAARAASGRERGIGDAYEAVDAEGNVIATEFLATRSDLEAFQQANPGATVRKAVAPSTDFDTVTFYGQDGQPKSFLTTTAQGRTDAAAALASGEFTAVPPPAPGDSVVLLNPRNPEDSIVVEAGTPEYSQSLRMGFRTAEDIEAQRKLTTPEAPTGEVINILMPDGTTQSVRADDPQADALIREGGRRVSTTAPPAPAETVTYVSPTDPTDFVRAVPGSPEAAAAETRGLVPAPDAATIAGMMPGPDGPAATLKERDRAIIINQETLDNLENLSPQQLSEFAASAATYVQEQVSPAGVSSREPLPPNTQEAMRRAHAAGISFPGIDPSLFGAPPRAEDLNVLALNILDPSTDLRAATGLLTPLQRGINLVGEQLAELVGGTGTAFVDTAEGSQALKTLAAATNRFYLAGKTLALEFSLLQEELVRPSGLRTDQDAIRALTNQRALLEGDLARVQQVLENPRGYTNADISTAREMQTYALQLLRTYDDFIQAYGGGRTGPLPTLNDIMSNPANLIQPQ